MLNSGRNASGSKPKVLDAIKVAPGQSSTRDVTYYVVTTGKVAEKAGGAHAAAKTDKPRAPSTPGGQRKAQNTVAWACRRASVDKRSSPRQRTRLHCGKIVDPRSETLIECQIYDLSEGGARLRLFAHVGFPAQIALFEPLSERLREASIVWSRSNEVGISFLPRTHARGLTAEELARLRAGLNPAKRRAAVPA